MKIYHSTVNRQPDMPQKQWTLRLTGGKFIFLLASLFLSVSLQAQTAPAKPEYKFLSATKFSENAQEIIYEERWLGPGAKAAAPLYRLIKKSDVRGMDMMRSRIQGLDNTSNVGGVTTNADVPVVPTQSFNLEVSQDKYALSSFNFSGFTTGIDLNYAQTYFVSFPGLGTSTVSVPNNITTLYQVTNPSTYVGLYAKGLDGIIADGASSKYGLPTPQNTTIAANLNNGQRIVYPAPPSNPNSNKKFTAIATSIGDIISSPTLPPKAFGLNLGYTSSNTAFTTGIDYFDCFPEASPEGRDWCISDPNVKAALAIVDAEGDASRISFRLAEDPSGNLGTFNYETSEAVERFPVRSGEGSVRRATFTPNPNGLGSNVFELGVTVNAVRDNQVVGVMKVKLVQCSPPPPPSVTNKQVTFYHSIPSRSNFANRVQLTATGGAPLKICADGFGATEVVYQDPQAQGPVSFRIIDGNGNQYGSFLVSTSATSSSKTEARYTHPSDPSLISQGSTSKTLRLEVRNSAQTLLLTHPVELYREPVVFVHGLYGSFQHFYNMERYFFEGGEWPFNIVYNIDFEESNSRAFAVNTNKVPEGIDYLLGKMREKHGYSAGRVAVVTHSMGGSLTRCYIQGDCGCNNTQGNFGYVDISCPKIGFRDDIDRWVSINGVLLGNQLPKALLDPNTSTGTAAELACCKVNEGAVASLAYDSPEFVSMNTTTFNRNMDKVPFHAIGSYFTPGLANINLVKGAAQGLYFTYLGLIQRTSVSEIMQLLFQGENDFAVPLSSQLGGFSTGVLYSAPGKSGYYDIFPDLEHTQVIEDLGVFDRVRVLLSLNRFSGSFTRDGLLLPTPAYQYNLPTLNTYGKDPLSPTNSDRVLNNLQTNPFILYPFSLPNNVNVNSTNEVATVMTNSTEASYSLQVNGTPDVVNLLLQLIIPTSNGEEQTKVYGPYNGSSYNFTVTLPSNTQGTVRGYVLANTSSGNLVLNDFSQNFSCSTIPATLSLANLTVSKSREPNLTDIAQTSISTSNFTLTSGMYHTLTAGTEVRLGAGTSIQAGSAFRAFVNPALNLASCPAPPPAPQLRVGEPPFKTDKYQVQAPEPETKNEKKGVQLYPNPNNGLFTLQLQGLGQSGQVLVKVYDLSGRLRHSGEYKLKGEENGEIALNLSQLPTGMYLCKVQAEGFEESRRLLIIK
jgi:hypothetical protein